MYKCILDCPDYKYLNADQTECVAETCTIYESLGVDGRCHACQQPQSVWPAAINLSAVALTNAAGHSVGIDGLSDCSKTCIAAKLDEAFEGVTADKATCLEALAGLEEKINPSTTAAPTTEAPAATTEAPAASGSAISGSESGSGSGSTVTRQRRAGHAAAQKYCDDNLKKDAPKGRHRRGAHVKALCECAELVVSPSSGSGTRKAREAHVVKASCAELCGQEFCPLGAKDDKTGCVEAPSAAAGTAAAAAAVAAAVAVAVAL
jgi:hypothetical protein